MKKLKIPNPVGEDRLDLSHDTSNLNDIFVTGVGAARSLTANYVTTRIGRDIYDANDRLERTIKRLPGKAVNYIKNSVLEKIDESILGPYVQEVNGYLGRCSGNECSATDREAYQIDNYVQRVLEGDTSNVNITIKPYAQVREEGKEIVGRDVLAYHNDGEIFRPSNSELHTLTGYDGNCLGAYINVHEIVESRYMRTRRRRKLSDTEHGRMESYILESLKRRAPDVYKVGLALHASRPEDDAFGRSVAQHNSAVRRLFRWRNTSANAA
ncbi:MAG: hypothetical protein KKA90_03550 [Nanoarchaeota archaeon]|nr:hypothetical protein [Nanoarchaeota archaeon]